MITEIQKEIAKEIETKKNKGQSLEATDTIALALRMGINIAKVMYQQSTDKELCKWTALKVIEIMTTETKENNKTRKEYIKENK